MWGWGGREEETLVAGSKEEGRSESTDATAVIKGLAGLASLKIKLQFWLVRDTKLLCNE